MKSKIVTIKNPMGLQVKQAGELCKVAMDYQSLITFQYEGGIANAKSMLSVLGACIKCGEKIELICEGKDEEEALKNLSDLIENHEGEF